MSRAASFAAALGAVELVAAPAAVGLAFGCDGGSCVPVATEEAGAASAGAAPLKSSDSFGRSCANAVIANDTVATLSVNRRLMAGLTDSTLQLNHNRSS